VLAFGVIAPLLIVLVAGGIVLSRYEREAFVREAIGRTRAAMSAIDTELGGSIAALKALAASKNLEDGDIRSFHEEAHRVLATQPQWRNIGLATVQREQLMDAIRPYGEQAPFGSDEAFDTVIHNKTAAISSLSAGTAVANLSIRVRVPVIFNGEVRYVLSAPMDTQRFDALLRAQQLPEGWVIGLADRNQKFIARRPPVPAGTSISPDFKAAIARSSTGWFTGHTLEAMDSYTSYVSSDLTGWVLGIAMPASVIEAGVRRALWISGVGALAALAIAIVLAWLIARRIARPIINLADAAGRELNATTPRAQRIEEIARLQDALHAAGSAVQERQRQLEAEQAALRRQTELLEQRTALAEALIQERKVDDRRKDEFLATLAHELRNPLAPIVSALQILDVAAHDPAATGKAREILDRQVAQMKRLIDDLMDISRISQGKLELQREEIELKSVVEEVIDVWRPVVDRMDHDLQVSLPPQPVMLDGDPVRLTQLLTNLLGNACKFTPPGGKIRIDAMREDADLVVTISDNGSGIAPELLPRLFDLFTQGDRSLERSTGGLGIGLALVKRLAQMHGGSVEARSEGPGKGAQFIVRLPIVVDAPRARSPENAPAAAPARSLRILLVDDNFDSVESLSRLLKLSGHQPFTANDGVEGVLAAERVRPEVVIMDIGMPRLNGYDAARRIREQSWGKDVILVAMSGWGKENDRVKSSAAGFDAHLVKPVDYAALMQVLAELSAFRRPMKDEGRGLRAEG
jgi:signal transduction histidine kinase/ActR/RegA family two-component response regulator